MTVAGTTCGVQLVDILGNAIARRNPLYWKAAGFDVATLSNNIVKFTASGGGTVTATVLQSGGTQLQVKVPSSAAQGSVTVTVGSGNVRSCNVMFPPGN